VSRVADKRAEEIARLREGVNDVSAIAIDRLLNVSDADGPNYAIEVSRIARHYLDGHREVATSECDQCPQEEK
jgi:hypothetical protein